MRILVFEKDTTGADSIVKGLRDGRFSADAAHSGEECLALVKDAAYDALVVGFGGGGIARGSGIARSEGMAVLAALRKRGDALPILVIAPETAPAARAEMLDAGADDCMAKPFAMVELLARLRALLRRERKMTGPVLAVGDIMLDTLTHAVTRAGKRLALGRQEFVLLEYLMRNPGVPLTRAMILEHAWDMNADILTNTVDVHISFLRAKIDRGRPKAKKMIQTVYGYGYKIGE